MKKIEFVDRLNSSAVMCSLLFGIPIYFQNVERRFYFIYNIYLTSGRRRMLRAICKSVVLQRFGISKIFLNGCFSLVQPGFKILKTEEEIYAKIARKF
ncbi:hypothetical protein BpHYR1_027504 [Brachionus plicatilis]|uniref:Uncharacterized protein n=1 Tax=Brachionus plicatilis TaxID=10195 RepID=A0A3M7RYE7_BRAPC|nr:hypothetical protein BpHYR1_027504 [Brachionus plicatilis]